MANEENGPGESEKSSREPTVADLRDLCRELNRRRARYIVIGGFAMMAAGYNRRTMDVDFLIDTTGDNEQRVLDAIATLPDGAAREIKPGEIAQWNVVRIGDEIMVDLMRSACALDYAAACSKVHHRKIDDVEIPFASPELLWLTKKKTHREKDIGDLAYLREWFRLNSTEPPQV